MTAPLSIDARFCDTAGKGVGRWRLYYRADTVSEARWAARRLVPSCQIRVRNGRDVIISPRRASTFTGEDQ